MLAILWLMTVSRLEAVISGEEQIDHQYILFFHGKTDSDQLDTRFGKH